jgi:hypothetical protein
MIFSTASSLEIAIHSMLFLDEPPFEIHINCSVDLFGSKPSVVHQLDHVLRISVHLEQLRIHLQRCIFNQKSYLLTLSHQLAIFRSLYLVIHYLKLDDSFFHVKIKSKSKS